MSQAQPENEPAGSQEEEEQTWTYNINVLGPNTAEVRNILQGIIPALSSPLTVQAASPVAPAPGPMLAAGFNAGFAPYPQQGFPFTPPAPRRRPGRPSRAEVQARLQFQNQQYQRQQSPAMGPNCLGCDQAPATHLVSTCGHLVCNTCLTAFVLTRGVCPRCRSACSAANVIIVRT